uniref:Uncharacterized protein n=1 Tax=Chromera velia CCMP2878 TaxID=1169474 RepID=A0A0G4HB59_9ALVE|mmetsp:Transcript_41388/g.81627  ORF Transcript_41388/g.81627 Transcript_41388/m.81627 type:complete len:461 (+) Transcript_41388:106-1488(+)|eukprot:Cvel_25911.t1-p1 / transcript=Cvel_25911.t1 / gene=Cvel_25911 / organism=Chromera_velia_CCMP2878 / gene_product=hypothetical protein / transcript_product=hypothetical protein / location=Cvel_scaffold2994:17154-18533(+) / protein_length=460 / sequence_SO=supercontig / SO=protein_coding / is_pseudo=false
MTSKRTTDTDLKSFKDFHRSGTVFRDSYIPSLLRYRAEHYEDDLDNLFDSFIKKVQEETGKETRKTSQDSIPLFPFMRDLWCSHHYSGIHAVPPRENARDAWELLVGIVCEFFGDWKDQNETADLQKVGTVFVLYLLFRAQPTDLGPTVKRLPISLSFLKSLLEFAKTLKETGEYPDCRACLSYLVAAEAFDVSANDLGPRRFYQDRLGFALQPPDFEAVEKYEKDARDFDLWMPDTRAAEAAVSSFVQRVQDEASKEKARENKEGKGEGDGDVDMGGGGETEIRQSSSSSSSSTAAAAAVAGISQVSARRSGGKETWAAAAATSVSPPRSPSRDSGAARGGERKGEGKDKRQAEWVDSRESFTQSHSPSPAQREKRRKALGEALQLLRSLDVRLKDFNKENPPERPNQASSKWALRSVPRRGRGGKGRGGKGKEQTPAQHSIEEDRHPQMDSEEDEEMG